MHIYFILIILYNRCLLYTTRSTNTAGECNYIIVAAYLCRIHAVWFVSFGWQFHPMKQHHRAAFLTHCFLQFSFVYRHPYRVFQSSECKRILSYLAFHRNMNAYLCMFHECMYYNLVVPRDLGVVKVHSLHILSGIQVRLASMHRKWKNLLFTVYIV